MTKREQGSVAIETAIIAPVVLIFAFAVLSVSGRSVSAKQQTENAAQNAARAASLQQTSAGARAAAENYLDANLAESELVCTMSIDTANMEPGEAVTVDLICTKTVLEGNEESFTGTAIEVIDTYRDSE